MTISDRFVLFMREKGITQKDFSERTGYLRQSLSKFITGNVKSPKVDLIIMLMDHYPELNIEWLLKGEGQMWNANEGSSNSSISTEASASGFKFLGKAVNPELLKELFETKDALIATQQKRIEDLEAELKRCREMKS